MNEHPMCLLRAGVPIENTQTAVSPKVMNPGLKASAIPYPSLGEIKNLLTYQITNRKYSLYTGLHVCVFSIVFYL
jgi:hypothetical protein